MLLESIKIKIFKLVERKKQNNEKFLLCDLHIHSNHSSDGTQSLEEIICETQKLGFEIIALTDHDSVSIFNDLYNLIKQNKLPEFPIIIPGIEQTISFKEYQTIAGLFNRPGTKGNSYNLYTVVYFVYDQVSSGNGNTIRYACAGAVVLFLIILAFTGIQFLVSKKKVHY